MTTVLQLVACKTEPNSTLRAARARHILEQVREIHDHSEKFEYCSDWLCVEARKQSGLDQDQIDLFRRSHGYREPGE